MLASQTIFIVAVRSSRRVKAISPGQKALEDFAQRPPRFLRRKRQ
jgi:hypothetical protein